MCIYVCVCVCVCVCVFDIILPLRSFSCDVCVCGSASFCLLDSMSCSPLKTCVETNRIIHIASYATKHHFHFLLSACLSE